MSQLSTKAETEAKLKLIKFMMKVKCRYTQAGFDVRRCYLDSAKYRNALHELVLNYTAIHPAERPPKLHLKFIDILTVLLQSGLDINDADYRSVVKLQVSQCSLRVASGMKNCCL